MPGIAQTDWFAVLLDVGHHQYFRMPTQLEIAQHMDLQRAEATTEIDLLRWSDALVAEHQHVIVQMRLMDTRKGVRIQRLRQIQPDHFGAQRGIERHDLHAGSLHCGNRIARGLRTRGGSDAGHDGGTSTATKGRLGRRPDRPL